MKRFSRIFFLILSTSLLLAAVVAWIAAGFRPYYVEYDAALTADDPLSLDRSSPDLRLSNFKWVFQISSWGTWQLSRERLDWRGYGNAVPYYSHWAAGRGATLTTLFVPHSTTSFLGFSLARSTGVADRDAQFDYRTWRVGVPSWFLVGLFAIYPFFAWRRYRRGLIRPGHCRKCQYDLRAHKAGDKCPECGNVIVAAFKTS